MSKENVAVVMGGFSGEYEVSLKSGETIYQNIDRDKFNVYRIIIQKDAWYFLDDNNDKMPIPKGVTEVELSSGYKIKFDVFFNTIHGVPGENGVIQAFWDLMNQRYTGCSSYLSALTFNKKDLLKTLKPAGIPSAPGISLTKGETPVAEDIIQKLGLPLFVKPNCSGSSLGAGKVNTKEDLLPAIEKAFAEDDEILIEKYLNGKEVSVGVVDYQGEARVLGITEIISKNEFFDYEAKYQGASEEITPAALDSSMQRTIEDLALKAYTSLGMSGFSRSEFIITEDGPFFLEMNTNPGFSPASILPQQAAYAGISLKELCTDEVEKALSKRPEYL